MVEVINSSKPGLGEKISDMGDATLSCTIGYACLNNGSQHAVSQTSS